MKKRLRKIRRAAGDARDLDVLIARLGREPSVQRGGVVCFLAEKRVAVQPAIVELAEQLRHEDRFIRKTARLVNKIAAPDEIGGSAPTNCFRVWAPRKLAELAAAFVEKMPKVAVEIEVLHQFRIRAKALRYAIELLAPGFGPQLREELYPAVEELQERLGKITDHIAAMKLLAEGQSRVAGDAGQEVAHGLLEMERSRQIEDLQDFQQWWTPDRAEWLKECLAQHSGERDVL